jgi:hypothetical protein
MQMTLHKFPLERLSGRDLGFWVVGHIPISPVYQELAAVGHKLTAHGRYYLSLAGVHESCYRTKEASASCG